MIKYNSKRYQVLLRYYVTMNQTSDMLLSIIQNHEQGLNEPNITYESMGDLLKLNTPAINVFLFVRAVLLKIIPVRLFGDIHNRGVFMKKVKSFLISDRYEHMTLGFLMNGVRTRCGWLRPLKSTSLKLRLMARLHLWLMQEVVCLVVKTYFYVTESSTSNNKIFFYPSLVWKYLVQLTISKRLQEEKFQEADREKVKEGLQNRFLIYSKLTNFVYFSECYMMIFNLGPC